MFEFGIIICSDGMEIIDRNITTPYSTLTPLQMVEYVEMETRLSLMDRMERRARAEAENQQKLARNPFYRLACVFGLV